MDECVNGLQFCLLQIYFVFDLVFFNMKHRCSAEFQSWQTHFEFFMMKTAKCVYLKKFLSPIFLNFERSTDALRTTPSSIFLCTSTRSMNELGRKHHNV